MRVTLPPIPHRNDVGGGALPAVHAVLRSLGAQVSYEELSVLSGAAFTFVYDNAPTYEPQRDLCPFDTLSLAAQATGFTGRWVVDRPLEETMGEVEAALAAGRPAIASIYDVDEMHGFGVVVDRQECRFTVQLDQPVNVPLPELWWGAVTGPRAWGARPVFLTEPGRVATWSAEGRLHRALHRAVSLLSGGWVPYRDCDGSRTYTSVPLAGRQAAFGLPAYDLLLADVGGAEFLGAFSLLWRLDAQLSQLQHSRTCAASYLRTLAHPVARVAEDTCTEAAGLAGDLMSRFWFRPTRSMTRADDVLAACATQSAMVFWVQLAEDELVRLSQRVPVTRTPWGPIAVVDTTPRRREAAALVQGLKASHERLTRQIGELRDGL